MIFKFTMLPGLRMAWHIVVNIITLCSPLWPAQPYQPTHPDPIQETWRWQTFPNLKGTGVRSIAQSTDGAIWFGTDNDIRRYDGIHWTTYKPEKDNVLDNQVFELIGTQDGAVYAGTDKGIAQFRNSTWERVFPPKGEHPWAIWELYEAPDGTIWASTYWGALHLTKNTYTLYTAQNVARALHILAPYVQTVVVPQSVVRTNPWREGLGLNTWNGTIWAIAQNGPGDLAGLSVGNRILTQNGEPFTDRLNGPKGTQTTLTIQQKTTTDTLTTTLTRTDVPSSFYDFPVNDVIQEKNGTLWFGIPGAGIVRHNPNQTDPEKAWHLYTQKDSIDVGGGWHLTQTQDGTIWAVTWSDDRGVNHFNGKHWTHTHLHGGGHHSDILKTRDGTLWLSGGRTLRTYQNNTWTFSRLPFEGARDTRLLEAIDGSIWVIAGGRNVARFNYGNTQWTSYDSLRFQCETLKGDQWFTTLDNKVVRRNKNNTWTQYGPKDGLTIEPNGVFSTRNGNIWVAGRHNNIAATAHLKDEKWHVKTHPKVAIQLHAKATFESQNGDLWFGGAPINFSINQVGGLLQFDGQTWTHHTSLQGALGRIYDIAQTADGKIWVGSNFGLRHFDGQTWEIITEPKAFTTLSVDYLYNTPKGDLWVGHRAHGAFHYKDQKWTHYTVEEGLADSKVSSILQTHDSSVWAITAGGVSRFDGQSWVRHALPEDLFEKSTGIQALYQTSDQALWINTTHGSIRYESDTLAPETKLASTLDEVAHPGNITFEWHGADAWRQTSPENLQYAYRIDNGAWSPFTSETHKTFLALSSGTHTFQVKTRDRDFNEDPTPAMAQFTVIPAIWQQAWFIGLIVVGTGIIVLQASRILISNKKLRQQTINLEQANQEIQAATQAKSRFLANMSHELRTPLNAILGYAQFLTRDKGLNNSQKTSINTIQRSGEHLLLLINDLLDLTRIEAQKVVLEEHAFHLPNFLTDIANMMQVRAEQKNLPFKCHFDSALPTHVKSDTRRLRQILINLLGNAIKFTHQGKVTFNVFLHAQNQVCFEVTDTGIGIAPEKRADIFNPFEQSHNDLHTEGIGLGLAISHQLVTLLGGTLQVKSVLGVGSRFWFDISLPNAHIETPHTPSHHAVPIGFKGPSQTVLIVDDKQVNRSMLSDLLKPLNFEILEAENGLVGLEKAIAQKPDLILLDLVMPVLDGFETMRRIRQHPTLTDTVIIALSASVFDENRRESLEAGSNDFLPKPIHLPDFFEKIGKHLNIDWVYEETPSTPVLSDLMLPPNDMLQTLFDLAQKGRIVTIREHMQHLEQEKAYQPFVNQLRDYTDHFRLKELCNFLSPYLKDQP